MSHGMPGRRDQHANPQHRRARWENLDRQSPNLQAADPALTIYRIKDQGRADVDGLVSILCSGSSGVGQASAATGNSTDSAGVRVA